MSKVQILRSLVKQRLTAAAEEICALFERTIAEYEEELCRSTEQNQRHRNLLDSALTPQLRLHRADVQQLLFGQKKVSPEQQEWSSSLDQQDPEPPHIKDEQEELWIKQEEADITEFTITLISVKHEDDDEEKPQSSQLHQRQTEQMETEADGQNCSGPEPAGNSVPDRHRQSGTEDRTGDSPEPETEDSPKPQAEDSPEPETEDTPEPQAEDSPEPQAEDSDDVWSENKEPQSSLNSHKNIEVAVSGVGCGTDKEQFTSSDCGEGSGKNSKLRIFKGIQTGRGAASICCLSKPVGPLQKRLRQHSKQWARWSCPMQSRWERRNWQRLHSNMPDFGLRRRVQTWMTRRGKTSWSRSDFCSPTLNTCGHLVRR
ncbi:uncharacterized protein LOC115589967 isoform X5 [Sparus aurata]|uniref:uncharacterized protein LOC115589967 isoform X5 n=1 Tax=Sparus aurata TaxID=8175 RepID=UPI0011C18CC7|nr:uncharacterized protein LOC115589967 isoform X5 [Sparus aurata]